MLQATAVPSDLGLTTVLGTHTNPNPAESVSMFALKDINNCVFPFSQNPVHGMPSSMTANTDNDHQAPKYLPNLHKFIQNSDFLYNMILLDVLHFQSDVFYSDSSWFDCSDG